jgi:hypothetical protein
MRVREELQQKNKKATSIGWGNLEPEKLAYATDVATPLSSLSPLFQDQWSQSQHLLHALPARCSILRKICFAYLTTSAGHVGSPVGFLTLCSCVNFWQSEQGPVCCLLFVSEILVVLWSNHNFPFMGPNWQVSTRNGVQQWEDLIDPELLTLTLHASASPWKHWWLPGVPIRTTRFTKFGQHKHKIWGYVCLNTHDIYK